MSPQGQSWKILERMKQVISHYRSIIAHFSIEFVLLDNFIRKMDEFEFKSPMFQRVFQYLRRHIDRLPLDSFQYNSGSVEGDQKTCLDLLLR